ncbi:proline-rich protein HaeIII subfamily 1-like [Caloenas nicobarica]|uniref:proline-rich protein HaeIII subfamily 1-like n=1 Tax=Caloenas nicobarica TaxID=187106 RepID=UPI0032B83740
MPPGGRYRVFSPLSLSPGCPRARCGKGRAAEGERGRAARPDANCPRQPRPLRRLLPPPSDGGKGRGRGGSWHLPRAQPAASGGGATARGRTAPAPQGGARAGGGRGRAPAAGEHAQWPAGPRTCAWEQVRDVPRQPLPWSSRLRCAHSGPRWPKRWLKRGLSPSPQAPQRAPAPALGAPLAADSNQPAPPRPPTAPGAGPAPPGPGSARPGCRQPRPGRPEGGWQPRTSEAVLGSCELSTESAPVLVYVLTDYKK